jgi:hypothetical protein
MFLCRKQYLSGYTGGIFFLLWQAHSHGRLCPKGALGTVTDADEIYIQKRLEDSVKQHRKGVRQTQENEGKGGKNEREKMGNQRVRVWDGIIVCRFISRKNI